MRQLDIWPQRPQYPQRDTAHLRGRHPRTKSKAPIRVSRATQSGLGLASAALGARATGAALSRHKRPKCWIETLDLVGTTPTTNEPHKQGATRWLDRAGDHSHARCGGVCLPSPTRDATRAPRAIPTDPRAPVLTGRARHGTRPSMLVSVSLRPRSRRRPHDRLNASQRAHALLGAAPLREIRVWDSCETACRCRPIRCDTLQLTGVACHPRAP